MRFLTEHQPTISRLAQIVSAATEISPAGALKLCIDDPEQIREAIRGLRVIARGASPLADELEDILSMSIYPPPVPTVQPIEIAAPPPMETLPIEAVPIPAPVQPITPAAVVAPPVPPQPAPVTVAQ